MDDPVSARNVMATVGDVVADLVTALQPTILDLAAGAGKARDSLRQGVLRTAHQALKQKCSCTPLFEQEFIKPQVVAEALRELPQQVQVSLKDSRLTTAKGKPAPATKKQEPEKKSGRPADTKTSDRRDHQQASRPKFTPSRFQRRERPAANRPPFFRKGGQKR